MGLVMKKRRLDRAQIGRFLFCGFACDELIAADKKPIVYDELDPVFLRDELCAETLAGARRTNEGVDPHSTEHPQNRFKEAHDLPQL
jgi:hypothetical protein